MMHEDVIADIHSFLLNCTGFTDGLPSTLPAHCLYTWGWGMDDAPPGFIIHYLSFIFYLIKKYGSTSYLRISQVLKWPPTHKVQEQLPEKPSRGAQKAQTTSLQYSYAISTPKVPLTFNKFEKTKLENFDFVHLLLLSSSTDIAQKVYRLCKF